MVLILNNISKIISLTEYEQKLFMSKVEVKQFKAKTIILSPGENCK